MAKIKVAVAAVGGAACGVAVMIAAAAATRREEALLILSKTWHLLLFIIFWFAIYSFGRGLWKVLRPGVRAPLGVPLALGVGAAVVLAYGCGWARLYYAPLVKVLIWAGAAAGVWGLRKELARLPEKVAAYVRGLDAATAFFVVGICAVITPQALTAAAPPIGWDALTYHLAVPATYARHHGFVTMPYNAYASMPLGGTLFYVWPYLWDGLIAANACYAVITGLAVVLTYRLARLWLAPFYAVLAAALWALTPTVLSVWGSAHADHFQAAFATAALAVYLGERAEGGKARWLWAVTAGALLGAAVAVKYTSFAVIGAFVAVLLWDILKKRTTVGEGAVILGVGAAWVTPWLVKAYVEQGNPVFPALVEIWGGGVITLEQYRRLTAWQMSYGFGRGALDYVLLPLRVATRGDVTAQGFCGIFVPYVLPLAAVAAFFNRRARRVVAFGWIYFGLWAFGPQQLRFLVAGLPALATAAAATVEGGAKGLKGGWERAWRFLWGGGVLLTTLPYVAGAVLTVYPEYLYILGDSQQKHLQRFLPFYRAQVFVNENTPADAKVLMLFTNHTLYLRRDAIYDSFFEASPFLLAAEKARDASDLRSLTTRWGADYAIVYYGYEKEVWPYYSARARYNFHEFFRRYGETVYRDKRTAVYKLRGGEG